MGITCAKFLEFDAGHRLQRHESKCRNVHGHRYRVGITCEAPVLDGVGRVIDFSCIKACVGQWIDDNWDHGFLVEEGDPILAALVQDKSKLFVMPSPPTAENIAWFLLNLSQQLLAPYGVQVVQVECWETPTSVATAQSAQDV